MNMIKRSCSILLAALMLTQVVACGGDKPSESGATTTAATTEDPANSKTPGFAVLTEEEKASYATLATQNAERADVLASVIEEYYVTGRGSNIRFAMYLNTDRLNAHGTASVWHITSVLSMTSRLWALNAAGKGSHYADFHEKTLNEMQYYKGTANIINYSNTKEQTMYAVNRANAPGKASLDGVAAVYDDQMWIVRDLVYCYNLTGEQAFLDEALSLTQACLDAWDTTKAPNGKEIGGIDWGPGYATKHTCSNAPLIKPLVEIYEILHAKGDANAQYYLDFAAKIYEWTKDHLRLSGNLYGDLVGTSGRELAGSGKSRHWETLGTIGNPDPSTYSYNTGAMISGAVALYEATGETDYLKDAKQSAAKAYRSFTITEKIDGESLKQFKAHPDSIYRSNTWFNMVLLEGYIDLYPYDTKCKAYVESFQASLDYAYEHYKTKEGLMPRDLYNGWDKKATVSNSDSRCPDLDKDIMDQASYAEMYAALAELYAVAAK